MPYSITKQTSALEMFNSGFLAAPQLVPVSSRITFNRFIHLLWIFLIWERGHSFGRLLQELVLLQE